MSYKQEMAVKLKFLKWMICPYGSSQMKNYVLLWIRWVYFGLTGDFIEQSNDTVESLWDGYFSLGPYIS
jgi:hypothetical protein